MSPGNTRKLPWVVLGVIVVGSLLAIALSWREQGITPLIAIASASVGTLILVKARNPIGWLFDAVAAAGLVLSLSVAYLYLHATSAPTLPGAGFAAMINKTTILGIVASLALILLWFPDGKPPSRRWAPVAWLLGGSFLALVLATTLQPDVGGVNHAAGLTNPLGVPFLNGIALSVAMVASVGLLLGALASVASVVVRFRRSIGVERQQLRWLASAGVLAAAFFALAFLSLLPWAPVWIGTFAWGGFVVSLTIAIPGSVAIAILRYHLYDIDLVISKTIVYGLLAAFIAVIYVAIVVGVGVALGLGVGNLPLSVIATGVVSLTFHAARERARRFANRIVFGDRATPYEVIARFSQRVGNTYATEDILPRTVRVIAEGVNAERATIWLALAGELRPAASWPEDHQPPSTSLTLVGEALPAIQSDHTASIRYRGELLGAITLDKPRGEPISPEEVKLVDDLAAQAGLVVSNVRLTADLEARLAKIVRQAQQLKASRQRIVAAQDEERRRLERNIHDGAQQHLVALAVKLRLARALIARDPNKAATMLREITAQVDDAIETLRTLALGIYPPLLEEHGVAAALAAQYQRSELPVHMSIDGAGRYPIETEAAVYFCVLEALQNAAKYANAGSIEVTLTERGRDLAFEVADDGVGFDRAAIGDGTGLGGMRDRLAVLGGDVELTSQPGLGTTVRGRVPLALEAVSS
jgi:signal transduction histidine kinase